MITLENGKSKNRLGVFVYYDKNGIVDEHVEYLLRESISVLSDLIIVCNGKITELGKKKLSKYATILLDRDNIGFDAGAWKEVIIDYFKGDLSQYDECLFFNDTFYGPFYSMKVLFNNMGENYPEADFWGITKHPAVSNEKIFEHIQTYFFVIRGKMLQSTAFKQYWNDMEIYSDVNDVIMNNEVRFTNYFFEKGFKYAVLCDTDKLLKDKLYKNAYITNPLFLLKECNNPFIKKKSLVLKVKENIILKNYVDKRERVAALNYIKQNYSYPIKIIWNNLNRTTSLRNRISSLGLLQCLKNM